MFWYNIATSASYLEALSIALFMVYFPVVLMVLISIGFVYIRPSLFDLNSIVALSLSKYILYPFFASKIDASSYLSIFFLLTGLCSL